MYNNDAWLFKAMQEYQTEQIAEEERRRRHPAAGAQAPKFQERLLENVGDRLVSLGLKLKARHQPETQ
jgi:hypothetical protein